MSAIALLSACEIFIGDLPQGVDQKPASTGGVAGIASGGSAGNASGGTAGQPNGGAGGTSGGAAGTTGGAGAGGGAGGTGGQGCPCDCDGDGFPSLDSACAGNDCDDTDQRAHPGQTAYFDTPRNSGGFDFDCDGNSTPEYTNTITCVVALCPSGQGYFATPPACGQSAAWGDCVSGLCTQQILEQRKQACR